jgi:hypothetical protein
MSTSGSPDGVVRHDAGRLGDLTITTRIFAAMGTIVTVMALIYWFTSYERAGTAMLALASVLLLSCATFLFREDHRRAPAPEDEAGDHPHYLPDSSPWPLGVGTAIFLVANGLILGWEFAVPGAVLLVGSMIGFIRQSRLRA